MKRILFSATFFDGGEERYQAGKHYPADDAEAARCVARGIAKEVDVADEPAAAPDADAGIADSAGPAADAKPGKAKK
jgi:hypothetical protein